MDVKPLNISLDQQGALHLLDMGSFQPLGRKINRLMVTYAFSHPSVRPGKSGSRAGLAASGICTGSDLEWKNAQ